MKNVTALAIFGLFFANFGCIVNLPASHLPSGPVKLDIFTPDERLRSSLEGTWMMCRPEGATSTLLVMSISGSSASLEGHTHTDAACASPAFETYKAGTFSLSEITTTDDHNGTAKVQSKTYYPSGRSFLNGILLINGEVFQEVQSKLGLSPDTNQLTLTLSAFKTKTPNSNTPLTLSFKRGTAPSTTIGGVKDGGLLAENDIVFDTPVQLIDYLERQTRGAFAASCITDYFDADTLAPLPEFSPFSFANILAERHKHSELVAEGYSTRDMEIFYFEDQNLTPYFGIELHYDSAGKDEKMSSIVCPISSRPQGIVVSGK